MQLTPEAKIASDSLYIRAIFAVVGFVSALRAAALGRGPLYVIMQCQLLQKRQARENLRRATNEPNCMHVGSLLDDPRKRDLSRASDYSSGANKQLHPYYYSL